MLALFLFGTVLLARDWHRNTLPGGVGTKELLVLVYGLILAYWGSFLPFFVNARALHPLAGFLFMVGAYGIFRLVETLVQKRFKAAALMMLSLAFFFCLASLELVPYCPDKARWHYARADSWLRTGEVGKAKAEAEQMLHESFSLYMPFRIGHALALKKEYALAERLLRAALGTGKEPLPYRQDLYYHIGVVCAADGRDEEARIAFEEALKLNPGDSRAHNDLAVQLEKAGDVQGALEHYQTAVEANPDFMLAWSNLGDLLGRTGAVEAAVDAFKNALKQDPDNPEIQYNLGVRLAEMGHTDEAASWYRSAMKLAPQDVRILNNLGLLLAGQGNRQEAETLFRRAIELSPDYTLARANLGNLLIDAGEFEKGISIYREGLALNPEDAELASGISYQYALHDNIQEAHLVAEGVASAA